MAVSLIATVGLGFCTDPGIASVAPLNPNGLCNRLSPIAAVGIPYGVELPLENRE